MCFGGWSEVPFQRSTNSIAGNVLGIVGNADEVGDMDFDSVSECSYARSDSAASADPAGASDLVNQITQSTTDRGSAINQYGYEAAVESFGALEERWLNEVDPSRKETLKNVLFETEVAFALRFAVYTKIVVGNQDEEAQTKKRTRNRMRTRTENKCCIGVPEEGRASKRARIRRVPRSRVDPLTRQIISWAAFQQQHNRATHQEQTRLWRELPRVRRAAKKRLWAGHSMTWSQCVTWYRDFYEMSALYVWFVELPRDR